MQQVTPPPGDRVRSLTDRVNALDQIISKMSSWFNWTEINGGSVMITGINERQKTDSGLITFQKDQIIKVPATRLREFIGGWAQDLISERLVLLQQIEKTLQSGSPVNDPGIPSKPLPGNIRERPCPQCNGVTRQQYGIYSNPAGQADQSFSFMCLECETVVP